MQNGFIVQKEINEGIKVDVNIKIIKRGKKAMTMMFTGIRYSRNVIVF